LLIGNDTVMAPPRYVLKEKGRAFTQARVELRYDRGVTVLPGRTYDNSTVYMWPVVPVKIHGRTTELPYRALVNATKLCPGGAVVSGQYRWVGGWVEVRGPTSIHCAEYPVEFLLPNGTSLVYASAFQQDVRLDAPVHRLPQRHQAGGRPRRRVCRRAEGGARKLHAVCLLPGARDDVQQYLLGCERDAGRRGGHASGAVVL
jgi:hypothetical protein